MTTFREVEAFVAVIDMGSFREAAQKLNTSQSAVSRLIRDFESGFDQPLFERGKRSSLVTNTGLEVLQHAREILSQRDLLNKRFADTSLMAPELHIGVTELAAMTWLPECILRLRSKYPKMQLEVETGSSAHLYSQIRSGHLDIAVVSEVLRSQNMIRMQAGREKLGWFCHPDYPISSSPTLAELTKTTLLMQSFSTSTGGVLSAWLSENSLGSKDIIQSDSLLSLLGLAKAGAGVACLPKIITLEHVAKGEIREVSLPADTVDISYVALMRIDEASSFQRDVLSFIRDASISGSSEVMPGRPVEESNPC